MLGPAGVGRHEPARIRRRRADGNIVGERQDPLVPKPADPFDQLGFSAGVVQPNVGHAASLFVVRLGGDPGTVVNRDSMANPASFDVFVAYAKARHNNEERQGRG